MHLHGTRVHISNYMKTLEIGNNVVAALDESITYRKFLLWQKNAAGGGEAKILKAMILDTITFRRPDGTFQHITESQYERMPIALSQKLNRMLSEELLTEATPDEGDKYIVTLPSGTRVKYRVALTGDQLAAEKWAAKTPHYLTAYLIERTFTFENADTGEFEPRVVEDLLEMTLADGYAMTALLTSEENNEDFFADFWGDLSESTPQDLSTTDLTSRKSRK